MTNKGITKEERLLSNLRFFDRIINSLNNNDFDLDLFRNIIEEVGKFFKLQHIYLIKCRNINFWELRFEWFLDKKYSKLYLSGNWENYLALYSYLGTGNHVTQDESEVSTELENWKSQFNASNILLIPLLEDKKVKVIFGFGDVEKKFFYEDEILILKQIVNHLYNRLESFEATSILRNGNTELRAEVSELSSQLNLIPAMIIRKSASLRYENVNDDFIKYTGFRKFDVIGKTDKELYPIEVATKLLDKDREALENEIITTTYHQLTLREKEYYFAFHRIPYRDRNDNFKKLLVVAHDITELFSAKIQSELASKAKSEFLANMSHELRTPLNSIIGFTELLLQDKINDEQQDTLSNIKQSSYSLLDLINDILDLNKIEAGKFEINNVAFDVRAQIREITSLFKPRVLEKNLRFNTKVDDNVPEVIIGDPLRVRQILVNLIGNSLKFTREGEINLIVKNLDEENKIGKTVNLEYSVTDTGIGIPKDKLSEIFEAFAQAEKDTTVKFGGTGLGLTISKRLLELMGGEIFVSSEVGLGSKFWFRLPAEVSSLKKKAKEETKPLELDVLKLIRRRPSFVLIIEDDISTIKIFERYLKSKDYKLITSQSGKNAIELAHKFHPDLILLDVNLPEKSGWDILRNLKSDVVTKSIPVVVCTILQEKQKALNLGAVEYLEKPFDSSNLLEVLNRVQKSYYGKGRIVIVDDDELILKKVDSVLQKAEYTSECFNDSEIALRSIIDNPPPSLIILDLMMPKIDGFQFIDELRKRDDYTTVPIIVLTSKDLSEDEQKILRQNCDLLIQKDDFDAKLFIEQLDKILNNLRSKSFLAETEAEPSIQLGVIETIPKLHVLLVEDNLMNQKFMSHILKKIGATYQVAVDGKDCLEKIEAEKFDLVLMDIQMPVMDGIEATKHIRQKTKFKNLPIIALTAHAMKGDQERCLHAGCNGYITKPVDQQKLVGEIMSLVKTTEHKYEKINPYFQGFDKEEIIKFQTEYIDQLKIDIQNLDKKLSPREFETFKFFGHNIKGNGVAYGFPEISKIGAELEIAAKEQDYASLTTVFDKLKRYVDGINI